MIQIVCTPTLTTGGAELLHQLCHELQNLNYDASITYYKRKDNKYIDAPINPSYARYIKQENARPLLDTPQNIIIFPETMAYLAFKIRNAKVIIWWLSVDNYLINFNFDHYYCHGFKKTLYELKKIGRRPSFKALSRFTHIAQSNYAVDFLHRKKIPSTLVSDFINLNFVGQSELLQAKEDIICYNPSKGIFITKRIIKFLQDKLPHIKFTALVAMNSMEIKEVLSRAKIYIDFGHHPGKDRMPREAALQKCVVVVGKRGAAFNDLDIPIDPCYKIEEKNVDFFDKLLLLIGDILKNYEKHKDKQNSYFNSILGEKAVFTEQVTALAAMIAKNQSL